MVIYEYNYGYEWVLQFGHDEWQESDDDDDDDDAMELSGFQNGGIVPYKDMFMRFIPFP